MTDMLPSRGIFITGGSGFIGNRLLYKLGKASHLPIYCLTRQPENLIGDGWVRNGIESIKGDLFDTQDYTAYLKECDTVIHLAAATGKAGRDEYFHVNVHGTETLVQACKNAGIKNFLYVSTIAVKYPEKTRYYYAQSKEQAENIVKTSGLNYSILRPTIVIGKGSAIWKSLSGLVVGGLILMFGDGKTGIQPIYVDDLVDCMLEILKTGTRCQVLELGGPEKTSFDQFVQRIQSANSAKRAKIVHLPLKPIKAVLAALETVAYNVMPVTIGQLSAFNNDGTIQTNQIFSHSVATMKGVKEMVELVISQERSEARQAGLKRECLLMTRYLIGQDPSDYVISKYIDAHKYSEMVEDMHLKPFDRFLLRAAVQNTFFLKVIDAYSAIFARSSVLRNKLILMVAILESCAPSYRRFEAHETSPKIITLIDLIGKGIGFAITFASALLFVIPAHIVFALHARLSGERLEGKP